MISLPAMYLSIVLFLTTFSVVQSARILGVFNHPARSHTFLGTILFEELVKRGHNVVFINSFPTNVKHVNFKNIVIEGIAEDLVKREMMYFNFRSNQHRITKESIEMSMVHMAATFENQRVKKLIEANELFDVIIVDHFYNDANLIFGHLFKAPVIVLSSMGNTLSTLHLSGNDLPFSYVPGCSLQHSDDMSFWERLKMSVYGTYFLWSMRQNEKRQMSLLRKYFKKVPSMKKLYENVALVLVNSHFSFETPRPSTPNVISIGGFHVQPRREVDEDLKKLLDNAKDGVIVFSFGSQIKTSNMDNSTIRAISRAFSRFSCVVLWKYEVSTDFDLPNNVYVRKWLPQIDILAHPNVKLLITHGGLLSLIEALSFGIPTIVIPFNGDQHMNAKFIETRRIGKMINLEDINEDLFTSAIEEILSDEGYKQRADIYANLLTKQPIPPLDQAMFWIEHVIQHGGAAHLKPHSLKLEWYQYYSLDVLALLISALVIALSFVNFVIFLILTKYGYFKSIEKVKIF